ncbi:MAG: hypothetical protein P9X26_04890 [Candidatus Stygibacter frigidus]|nr:hypothetical protein [Candidatus Stygibacter frigidus]
MLLFLLFPPDKASAINFDFLAAITQKLHAENAEEPDVPFLDKYKVYPPEHWEMFSGASFWKTINVLNPKLIRNNTPFDATTLAGLSAWSFRFQFSDKWLPSATDPFCGYNCSAYILPLAGYETVTYFNSRFRFVEKTSDKNFISHGDFFKILNQDIKDNIITFTGTIFPHPDYGVPVDVQKMKKMPEMPRDKKIPYPWVMIQINGWHQTDISNLYKQSLIMATLLYKTDRIGNYASGKKAIVEWISSLKAIDKGELTDPDLQAKACFSNSWTYHSLLEARSMAKEYLLNNIDKFDVDKQMITDLAEIYEQEIEILQKGQADLLPLTECRKFDDWSLAMRQAQINTLTHFLVQEEDANQILQKISQ